MKRIKPRNLILLAIIVLALLLGAWSRYNLSSTTLEKRNPERNFHNQDHPQKRFQTATVFSQPRTVPPFSLVDDTNKAFTLNNLKGQWNLVFFGFTHCPGLCPTTLSTLNKTYQLLETYHLKQVPQIIFISVDPEQDDVKTIKKYLKGFNGKFIGVTGDHKEIDKLTQSLSVLYMKVDKSDSKEGYTIDHSGTILIINPEGQFLGVFTMPHDASRMAQDIKLLLSTTKIQEKKSPHLVIPATARIQEKKSLHLVIPATASIQEKKSLPLIIPATARIQEKKSPHLVIPAMAGIQKKIVFS